MSDNSSFTERRDKSAFLERPFGAQFYSRHGFYAYPEPQDNIIKRTGVFCLCLTRDPVCNEPHILLLSPRYSPHLWEMPGGGVDAGEDFQTALQREILEETSLHIDLNIYPPSQTGAWDIWFSAEGYKEYWDYRQYFHRLDLPSDFYFSGRRDNHELGQAFWVPVSGLNFIDMQHFHGQALRHIYKILT